MITTVNLHPQQRRRNHPTPAIRERGAQLWQGNQDGVIERRFRASPLRDAQKAKGRFLLRDLAPSVPIFGDPVLVPDHNACHPGIIQHPRAEARVYLNLL
jgi:hypothetical protein